MKSFEPHPSRFTTRKSKPRMRTRVLKQGVIRGGVWAGRIGKTCYASGSRASSSPIPILKNSISYSATFEKLLLTMHFLSILLLDTEVLEISMSYQRHISLYSLTVFWNQNIILPRQTWSKWCFSKQFNIVCTKISPKSMLSCVHSLVCMRVSRLYSSKKPE